MIVRNKEAVENIRGLDKAVSHPQRPAKKTKLHIAAETHRMDG
ncbi:MAG: hypothetical protein ABSG33_11665 [Candidatus Bathyarchaeia archaeon]